MQPHQPFRSKPDWWNAPVLGEMAEDGCGIGGSSLWKRDSNERPTFDEMWDAYRDNLAWVMDDLTKRLFANIDGSIVVSADHGNAMGEWGVWGHPAWSPHPKVRKVPWVKIEGTDEHTVEGIINPDWDTEMDNIADKLQALGYM
jgi:hypothetical protein